MSRRIVWAVAIAAAVFTVDFACVDSAEAQLFRRRNCCHTTHTTHCYTHAHTVACPQPACNTCCADPCACPTMACATPVAEVCDTCSTCSTCDACPSGCVAGCSTACPTACCAHDCRRVRFAGFRARRHCCPTNCSVACDPGISYASTVCGPATAMVADCGCGPACDCTPASHCGCAGEVMPASYVGSGIEGCPGGDCGSTQVIRSGDMVIERASESTPLEAPQADL